MSGVVDSCDGFDFPECGDWKETSEGNYYFDTTIKYDQPISKPDFIYTIIAGIHTP